jgi:DNA-binding PadR family transcriptional regulator
MSDLPVLSIGSEQDSVDTLLERILTRTDIKIIEVTAQILLQTGETPTASDILKELAKTNSLKKTQLYERLNRLTRLGFISARILPRPRKYITNYNTITEGVDRWIEEQMTPIADLSSGLESFSKIIKQTEPGTIVSAITEKLSLDFTSNTG